MKLKIKSARFFVNGQNLLFTNSGFDPEVNTDKTLNGFPSGIDYLSYPRSKAAV
jgi:iron complex outermembrane receptor protein